MRCKNEKRSNIVGICILIFLGTLFFASLYFYSFFNMFVKFNIISQSVNFILTGIVGLVSAIFILIYVIIRIKKTKVTRFDNWLSLNYPKLILYYTISTILFGSIRNEIVWSFAELKDFISLEWSIFGISITIFLVWDVLILQYLKKKRPEEIKALSLVSKSKYISQKESFFQDASTLFNSITLLTINLIVLIITTGISYISSTDATLLNQNMAIVTLYFCTNTILILFFDILTPLKEEKKELLKGMKVTQEDISLHNDIVDEIPKILTAIEQLDKLTNIDEEEKKKLKLELTKKIIEIPQLVKEDTQTKESETISD